MSPYAMIAALHNRALAGETITADDLLRVQLAMVARGESDGQSLEISPTAALAALPQLIERAREIQDTAGRMASMVVFHTTQTMAALACLANEQGAVLEKNPSPY